CLLTLEELGYVTRNARSFLLRPKVLQLGAAYLESMNIEQLTKTHLEELARNTSDSAALCVLDGCDTVYVARASVRTLLRLEAHVGSRFPAHATSTGRVLLAGLSAERLQRYFDAATLEPLTERTVTSATELRSLIAECRRNGYAVVEDELAYGVVALAVPVLDQQRRVVAALRSAFRLVRLDRRGHGQSGGVPAPGHDALDLAALCRHLGLARVALLGMSQGARGVLGFVAAEPARVSCLVLDGVPDFDVDP